MYSRGKLEELSVAELRKIAYACGYQSQKMTKQDWVGYILRNQHPGAVMEYFELRPVEDEYGHMLLVSLPNDDLAKEYGRESGLPADAEAGFFAKSLPSNHIKTADQERFQEALRQTNLYIYATNKRDCYLVKEYLDSCFVPHEEM